MTLQTAACKKPEPSVLSRLVGCQSSKIPQPQCALEVVREHHSFAKLSRYQQEYSIARKQQTCHLNNLHMVVPSRSQTFLPVMPHCTPALRVRVLFSNGIRMHQCYERVCADTESGVHRQSFNNLRHSCLSSSISQHHNNCAEGHNVSMLVKHALPLEGSIEDNLTWSVPSAYSGILNLLHCPVSHVVVAQQQAARPRRKPAAC